MSRQLGYALTRSDYDQWAAFKDAAIESMDDAQRATLAFMALRSLQPDQVEMVAKAVLQPMGDPLPPFLSPMDEARWWAGYATHGECKAYALAAYEELPTRDQMAFRRHITEIEIAA